MNRMIPLAASLLMAAIPLTSPAQMTWFSPRNADESPSFLGILMQDVTAESASELGLKRAHGALCMEVVPDTPAEEAGLLANDVVTRWDGTRVRSARHLKRLVGDTPVGRTIMVGVQRVGDE